MIDLVIDVSCAMSTSLMSVIECFSKVGNITWLGQESSKVPLTALSIPVVSEIDVKNDRLTLLIAPPEGQFSRNEIRGVARVLERHSAKDVDTSNVVIVDDFSQLELLSTLHDYPGMCRLIECHSWLAEDFRDAVLYLYEVAIDVLESDSCALVFGAQRLGESVCSSLQSSGIIVKAFLDNNASKHGTYINEIPVLALSDIEDKTLPVIIATTRFTSSIVNQLEDAGFQYILPYSVMSLLHPEKYPDEIPYIGIQQDFANNIAKYIELFLNYSDSKSRYVLDGLIRYRLDYDSRLAAAVSDKCERQYFDENLIRFDGEDIFVDLGGYDGDTAEKFIKFSHGKYKRIYLFEPDEALLKRAVERLTGFQSIDFITAGAYSKDGVLRFSASGRTNGAFNDEGEKIVPVRKLDSAIKESATFVKMDIEGAETDALYGAEQLLKSCRPKLAIAAYHFAPDLWRLVDVVRDINPSYRFYLRHYSETGLESVIYAI